MPPLTCKGRDQVTRVFEYEANDDGLGGLDYRVQPVLPLPTGVAFDFSLKARDDGTYQVVMMNHHGVPEYVAMGIPEAMILELANQLHARIVSSPGTGDPGEYREPEATKVWERLKDRGLASYDHATDRYSTA